MLRCVVVGTDGSPPSLRAVARAEQLAERFEARLVVVSAQDDAATAQAILDKVAARGGRAFEARAETGDPAEALVRVAEAEDADLVVVGNRGMQGVSRFLGSVPNKVSHHLDTSLLIVHTMSEREIEPYKKVLVGTDGSDGSRTAIAVASEIAHRFGATLSVLHAYEPRSRTEISSILAAGHHDLGNLGATPQAEAVLNHARKVLQALGHDARFEYVGDSPTSALLETADLGGYDLLVTGSLGMSGPGRFLLGGVPNRISHHTPCDHMIVSPNARTAVDLSAITPMAVPQT